MSHLKRSQSLPGKPATLQSAFDKVPIIAQHAVSDSAKETLELVHLSALLVFSQGQPLAHLPDRCKDLLSKNAFLPTQYSSLS